MTDLTHYYEILKLKTGASPAEVKQAYRKLVKEWHPDQFANSPTQQKQAEERIKLINEAYEFLKSVQQTAHQTSAVKTEEQKKQQQQRQRHQNLADARIYYQQGVEKAKHEQYQDALTDFSQAIFLDSNYVEAYKYRGLVYSILGQEEKANQDLRKVAQLKKQSGKQSAYGVAAPPASVHPAPRKTPWICAGTLHGHQDVVSAIALSPDGYTFVSSSFDETVRLWQVSTGRQLRMMNPHAGRMYCVAISPDGKYIASGGEDSTIHIWELQTGRPVRTLGGWIKGHHDTVLSVKFHPDGKRLVSSSADQTVRFWHLQSGRELRKLPGYSNVVTGVDVSPDGKFLVSVGHEKIIKLRHMGNGRLIRAVRETFKSLTVAFSPKGHYFATADADHRIRIWNWEDGDIAQVLEGHTAQVCAVYWCGNEQRLVSGSFDHTIKLWNTQNGHLIHTLRGHEDHVLAVVLNREGRTLISGSADHTIKIWWYTGG